VLYCVLLLWEHCQFPYVPCTVQHHCMFHNVPHTVQHYLQVSVSLTHFTTCHFLFYNALYLLLVLQYPLYSSTLPAVLHCPSLSSVHPASFVMSLIQFSTPCQFLKCPSFRSILPATCAMSLIQFNTPCHLCYVPHSIQHSLPLMLCSSFNSTLLISFTKFLMLFEGQYAYTYTCITGSI
jgi:hypothetical protein